MILVAGSANLDFVVRAQHIPAPGETVLGFDFKTFPGGKGANQAIACARAGGADTQMLLALGDDAFAKPLEASLNAAHVRLHIKRSGDPTGTAFICVSDDAENAITVAPGANHALTPTDLPPLAGISHLLMQLETPLACVTAYAQAARAQGVTVVLNAAPAQALPAELLALIDILIVNAGELAAIANMSSDHADSVEQSLARVHVPCVIVTLGAEGAVARIGGDGAMTRPSGKNDHSGQLIRQAAFPIKPVDTTAAGDTFCGVLVAALAQGLTVAQSMRRACAAGALACTKPGAQTSIPTQAELETFLKDQPTA